MKGNPTTLGDNARQHASYGYAFRYDSTGRVETIFPKGGLVSLQYKYDAASMEGQRDNVVNSGNRHHRRYALNRMPERGVILNASVLASETA